MKPIPLYFKSSDVLNTGLFLVTHYFYIVILVLLSKISDYFFHHWGLGPTDGGAAALVIQAGRAVGHLAADVRAEGLEQRHPTAASGSGQAQRLGSTLGGSLAGARVWADLPPTLVVDSVPVVSQPDESEVLVFVDKINAAL